MKAIVFAIVSLLCVQVAFAGTKAISQEEALMLSKNATANTNCGGNCPGGCDSCPCGETPSSVSISSWCARNSLEFGNPTNGWSQSCCECIASHESGGDANAVNENSGGSYDVGLWQINTMNYNCSGGSPPCSTDVNLNCAKMVFGWGGSTWKYWSTCGACGCCGRA